jgi:hypothetical protein
LPANLIKPTYTDSVFINCPFDDHYHPLLRATIFAVYRCGFYPTSALAEDNALDNRIDKIFRIIEKCKYGIHDISRIELNATHFPRFNMPFELGVFYGARRFGLRHQKLKNALILERTKYTYQQYLSDINGVDIRAHDNDPTILIRHIRNWLQTASGRKKIPPAAEIISDFAEFNAKLRGVAAALGFSNVNEIPFLDYCTLVEEGLRAKLDNASKRQAPGN